MDLTKYIAEKPPVRGLVRYLDSEIRKIQRAIDSIAAWKTELEAELDAPYTADWQALAYSSGWINYGLIFGVAGYYKDRYNRVHFRGLISDGPPASTAFVLPVGYRPAEQRLFPCLIGDGGVGFTDTKPGRIDIWTDGSVRVEVSNAFSGVTLTNWVSLDGISFYAG